MATYLDVAALVGIKIHSSGKLSVGESVTVPSGNYYALVQLFHPAMTTSGNTNDMPSPLIAGSNQAIAISSTGGGNGAFSIGGHDVGSTVVGITAQYVIFQNNQ